MSNLWFSSFSTISLVGYSVNLLKTLPLAVEIFPTALTGRRHILDHVVQTFAMIVSGCGIFMSHQSRINAHSASSNDFLSNHAHLLFGIYLIALIGI